MLSCFNYIFGCFVIFLCSSIHLLSLRDLVLVDHLELVWHPTLIMSLLVLSIGSVQYVMDLLVDVLNVLNEVFIPVSFGLDKSQICLSSYKWYGHINGT